MTSPKIGIIGLGFVGKAIAQFFTENKVQIRVYDKYKAHGIFRFDTNTLEDIWYLD